METDGLARMQRRRLLIHIAIVIARQEKVSESFVALVVYNPSRRYRVHPAPIY